MTHWFRHDSNAHMNERMLKIQSRYDWAGYGMAWFILEQLYNNDGTLDDDAMTMICKRNAIAGDFIEYCVGIGFIKHADGKYYSDRLNEELGNRDRKSQKAKESAMARWSKPNMRTHSERNATRQDKTREDYNVVVDKKLLRWLKQKGKGDGYAHWLMREYGDAVDQAWAKVLGGRQVNGPSDFVDLCKTLHVSS